jgi:hypothetical protein
MKTYFNHILIVIKEEIDKTLVLETKIRNIKGV